MKKNNRSLFQVLIVIVFAIAALNAFFNKNPNNKTVTNVIAKMPTVVYNDKKFYDNWRTSTDAEMAKLTSILIKANAKNCSEYFVVEDNGEYIIACTSDNLNYSYFVAWPRIEKGGAISAIDLEINRLPHQMEKK